MNKIKILAFVFLLIILISQGFYVCGVVKQNLEMKTIALIVTVFGVVGLKIIKIYV